MAVITPPLYQAIDSVYSADELGLPFRDLIGPGVVGENDLAVTQRAAGANLSVDVAAGSAWVRGSDSGVQPTYRCRNSATVNLAIAAAHATNPRIDLVIAEVRDAAFSGVSTDWQLRVITGTPAASPAVPTTPVSSLRLAQVSVPALDTTISTAQITGLRVRAQLGRDVQTVPLVTALPSAPYDGQVIDYLAGPSTGVVWRLRYRVAEAGSFKWYFVGGSPLHRAVAPRESTTSVSYIGLATTGPTIEVPLAGDYDVRHGAKVEGTVATAVGFMAVKIGAAAPSDVNAMEAQPAGANFYAAGAGYFEQRLTSLASADGLVCLYKINTGTGWWSKRTLTVTPVRVG